MYELIFLFIFLSIYSFTYLFKNPIFVPVKVAAPGPGDCAFEDDECGWNNPERREGVDELNWDRSTPTDGSRYNIKINKI